MNVSLVDKTDVLNYMSLILVGKMRKAGEEVPEATNEVLASWNE